MGKRKKKVKEPVQPVEPTLSEGQKKRNAFNELKIDTHSLRKSQKKADNKRKTGRAQKLNMFS